VLRAVVAKYPNVRYRVALAFAENQLPKLDVAGSSQVSRSIYFQSFTAY
jgi:hypothetical protein